MTYADHLAVARARLPAVTSVSYNHLDPGAQEAAHAALLRNPQRIRVLSGYGSTGVLTDTGILVRGAIAPEGAWVAQNQVVYVGLPVRWREVTPAGAVVFDWDGVQGRHLSANGWSYNEHDDSGAITEVEVVT